MIFQTNDDTTTTPKIWPCRASTLYGRVPGRYFEGSRSVITFGRRSPFVRHIPFQDKSTFGRRRGRHIFWLNELCNDDDNNNDNNDNNNNVVISYQSIGSLFDPMNDLHRSIQLTLLPRQAKPMWRNFGVFHHTQIPYNLHGSRPEFSL